MKQIFNRVVVAASVALLSGAGCVAGGAPEEGAIEEPEGEIGEARQGFMELRTNSNTQHNNIEMVSAASENHHRQLFVNNVDTITNIRVKIGGEVTLPVGDSLNLKLFSGCGGDPLVNKTVAIDPMELTKPTAWKWIDFQMKLPVTYGAYYYFEVSTTYGADTRSARLVLNTDRYEHGRHVSWGGALTYPAKKRDIMFEIAGSARNGKDWYPEAQTNVVCPEKCVLVHGAENTTWGARNHFNVIIQENEVDSQGSFWADHVNGHIGLLRDDIVAMLEGSAESPGLRETVPYSDFYSDMNFYIAIEEPAKDPFYERGFMHCANIDAGINVVTSPAEYGGGAFRGGVSRPSWISHGWGPDMRFTLVHELFGHGMGSLKDEYVDTAGPVMDSHMLFTPNSDAIGCPSWCDDFKDRSTLADEMVADPNHACWGYTDAECAAHAAQCYHLGSVVPAIPYFEGRNCVPKTVVSRNIGIGCTGNSGCYIGAPYATSASAYLNVAQPNSTAMQSTHHPPAAAPGFSTPVEHMLRDQMNCMFPVTCAGYDIDTCNALQLKWNGTDPSNRDFARFGKACDGGLRR